MTSPTPDYADWTQPTAQALRTATLIPFAGRAAGSIVNSGDTSQYQSATLQITYPTTGGVGDRWAVRISQDDGTATLDNQQVTFHSGVSYGNQFNGFDLTFPLLGKNVSIQLSGPAGPTVNYGLAVSTRQVPASKLTPYGASQYPLVGLYPLTALAAGATGATVYVPPSDRALSVRLGGSAGPGNYRFIAPYYNAGGLAGSVIADLPAAAAVQYINPLACPRMALEFTATNNDTVARSLSANIWDVS